MGKIAAATYTPPQPKGETSNQYDELLKDKFAEGVGAAFSVTFTDNAEYKTEMPQIRRAANRAGFTARNFQEEGLTVSFVLRPKYEGRGRKPKSETDSE